MSATEESILSSQTDYSKTVADAYGEAVFLCHKKTQGYLLRDSLFTVLYLIVKSDSSFNLTGTHATCASINSARRTVNDSLHSFYIGLPGSV